MDKRRIWGAAIFPIGRAEVFGGIWDSNRLHWTRAIAVSEIEAHVIEIGLLPLQWSRGNVKNGDLLIGSTHVPSKEKQAFGVLVRSIRLPEGEPPPDLSREPPLNV
jgi:hypothetical protein